MRQRYLGPAWATPAFLITVIGYVAATNTATDPLVVLAIKPLPVLVLAAALWTIAPRTRHRTLVTLGLVCCAVGDVALHWGLIPGIAAFLVGHLWYTAAFVASERTPMPAVGAVMAAWVGALVAVLWSGLGDMRIPVIVYAVVIGVMMWRAGALLSSPLPRPSSIASFVGAVSFGISDSMIAIDRFGTDITHGSWWIMGTYWLGQLLIARGAVTSDRWAMAARPPTPEDFEDPDER